MLLSKWDIDKRYLKLDIKKGDEDLSILSSLGVDAKISFNTTESVSGAVNEANIVINGILPKKMAYLSTSSTQWIKEAIQNRIIIDAGYEQKGHGVIFDGIITDATPQLENANYSITIKALNSFGDMLNSIKSYSFEGDVPASEIANKFAVDLKFVFLNSLSKDVIVSNYSLKDKSIIDHIRYLSQITGLDVYTTHNRLFIKERGKTVNDYSELVLDYHNIVGTPVPTSQGFNVNIRLNPFVLTGQSVKINSQRFDTLNSENFVLQSMSHVGDTRGSWITRCVLFRKDLLNG